MYLNIHARITIGNLEFTNVNQGEVVSTWKEITDTCKLTLPRTFYMKDPVTGTRKLTSVKESIKENDLIKVEIGYNGAYETEFEGYIRTISPEFPIVLEGEDEMLKLKGKPLTMSWESVSLKTLVAYLLKEYKLNYETNIIDDIELGNYEINRSSAARVLQELKEYGIYATFNGKVLYVGFPYAFDFNSHVYHLQKNVKGRTSLKFKTRENFPVKVKAISHRDDGTKITIDVPGEGDPDYDLTLVEEASERTLNFGHLTETALKQCARAELDKFSYNGYYGSITGFGLPLTRHGDIVEIRDARFPEFDSKNIIDKVTVRWGPVYLERINELGKQV